MDNGGKQCGTAISGRAIDLLMCEAFEVVNETAAHGFKEF